MWLSPLAGASLHYDHQWILNIYNHTKYLSLIILAIPPSLTHNVLLLWLHWVWEEWLRAFPTLIPGKEKQEGIEAIQVKRPQSQPSVN